MNNTFKKFSNKNQIKKKKKDSFDIQIFTKEEKSKLEYPKVNPT